MARREFSASVRRAAWERSKGRCEVEGCGVLIVPGQGPEYHHSLEAMLDGAPTLENCVVACIPCHRAITRQRAPILAKTRRLERATAGIKPRKQKIPGSKGTGFRRKLNGTVERV